VSTPLNPYIAGAPVTDARMFFGREDIFDWIEHNLAGQYGDHILVLHGQRRVGKTSVLKQLPARLPRRYIPVFFDLQGRTHTSLDRFLWWLAREIVRVLKQEREIVVSLPEKEAFAGDAEYLETQFLPALEPILGESSLLLTFDEFDTLEVSEARESLGRPLVETLHRLMGRRGLNFIFSIGSSGRKLENMQAAYTEFFKAALYKKVTFLSRADAARLITQPVEGILEYDPPAVERILRLASGHPYFTQLTCHEAFSLCQQTAQSRVHAADVERVLDDVIERGTVNLKFVWDEASDIEKWALAGLARLEAGSGTPALAAFLRKQRVRFPDLELEAALIHLRDRDVLAQDNSFIIELIRLWLQKNRPIEQVREELTVVNPIASRYVEIGFEYRDAGQGEKAIASFGEALAADADNLPAQVGLASVYLEQGALAQAAEAFEKALAIDADDVVARSGMCEAQVRLGEQALSSGRASEARQAFHAVLDFNPEHGKARQRLADLCRQQAEAALAAGETEPALDLLREALTYKPDEPDLQTRLALTLAEHRRARLQALTTQARAAASAERWAEAITAWQGVLALGPDDRPAVEAELARLEKEAARAQAYLAAQAALGRRDYDEGIRLLKAIVLEDETYKDSARLMTQAIEARRRARPTRKWTRIRLSRGARLGLAVGLAAVVLGSIVFLTWDRFVGAAIHAAGTAAVPAATSDTKVCLLTEADGIAGAYYAPFWRAIEAAQATYSIEGAYVEGTDASNALERIQGFLGEGCDLVVSYWPYGEALQTAAAEHPEAHFLVLDTVFDTDLPNIMGMQFKTWEAAFLAGYLAAGMSQTGTVGTFGGMDVPAVTLYMDGFARGVEHYNRVHDREVVVLGRNPAFQTGLFIDTFEDAALARQASEDLLDQGADVLFPVTALLTTASAEAAQARESAYVIGADLDWATVYPEYANILLSSAQLGLEQMVTEAIRRLVEGAFPGELLTGNLKNGGVLLAPFHELDSEVPAELASELEALQKTLPAESDPNRSRHTFPLDTITALAQVSSKREIIFLGTAHAGIYRSDDGGQTWQPARDGLDRASITSLAIDPADPNLLYASVDIGGVYRSTDGGASWQPINRGIDLARISGWGISVVLDPQNRLHLWFADGSTVYESMDGGETWIGHETEGFQFTNLVPHLLEPDTLFATSSAEGQGVFASRDGGQTWTLLLSLDAVGIGPGQLAVDPVKGIHLYVGGYTGFTYRSSDGGATWRQTLDYRCDHLAADPDDAAAAYCARGGTLSRTADGGETWRGITDGELPSPISVLMITPSGYYAGTSDGLFVSTDLGLTWAEQSSGLPLAPVDLTMVRGSGPRLYGRTGSCPGIRSDVNASDWEAVPVPACTPLVGDAWTIHPDGQTAYATDGQRVWHSSDALASWDERSAPPKGAGLLAVHPANDGWVFSSRAGGGESVFLSTDGALTWQPVTGLEVGYEPPRMAFHHGDGSRVYSYSLRAAESEIDRSDDAGRTWRACQPGTGQQFASDEISQVLVDPEDRDRLLVATLGAGVLVSADGCGSWTESSAGLETPFVNALAASPASPETVYAATDVGVYVSEDHGASWSPLSGWLPDEAVVYSLVVDPENPGVLYAATPQGVFRWDTAPNPVPGSGQSWVSDLRAFADPILASLAAVQPVFKYDFSTHSPPVDSLFGDATITGGVLQCQVYNEGCGFFWERGTSDFVAEYEFTYMPPSNRNFVALHFRSYQDALLEFWMSLLPSPAQGADWALKEISEGGNTGLNVREGTSAAVALGLRARVTVIALGPRIAVLLNGEPLAFYTGSSMRGNGYKLSVGADQQTADVHFDNVQFWDISGYTAPPPTAQAATPLPTATAMPSWAPAFAKPILEAIAELPPVLEDDFTHPNPAWVRLPVTASITDGVLRCRLTTGRCDIPISPNASDFVLEFDFTPRQCAGCSISITVDAEAYRFVVWPLGGPQFSDAWDFWLPGTDLPIAGGPTDQVRQGQATRLTLVARGSRMVVYLNQQFTYAYDLAASRGGDNSIWVEPPSDQPLTVVDLDNLRLWDISGLRLP